MNVGPRSDGTIPEQAQQVLREVGGWLKVNGDAIYGTRPWTKFGEGPTQVAGGSFHDTDTKPYTADDFRFTTKKSDLFAIELGWPTGGSVTIHSLGATALGTGHSIQDVSLLGSNAKIEWRQDADGLQIKPPSQPATKYAYVYRVKIQ